MDINFQLVAVKALRDGIESYDKRQGWRGPITNKYKEENWKNKLKAFKIDQTLNWLTAEVTDINDDFLSLKSYENENLKIKKSGLKWIIKDNNIEDVFNIGDFVFIKKIKQNGKLNNTPK